MVSKCEVLLNVVMAKEPKMLKGSTQNGNVAGHSFDQWECTDIIATGEKAQPNPTL